MSADFSVIRHDAKLLFTVNLVLKKVLYHSGNASLLDSLCSVEIFDTTDSLFFIATIIPYVCPSIKAGPGLKKKSNHSWLAWLTAICCVECGQ